MANLTNTPEQIITGRDSYVIVENLETIRGGRTLDVTGVAEAIIEAGHVIIQETATGKYKPMPVSAGNYAALPASHTYAGVLVASIETAKPFASILVRGTVNPSATKYAMTSILAAFKTAQPLILWRAD
jgi:hypothetical protein